MEWLTGLAALLLALLSAWGVHHLMERRGLLPPGFAGLEAMGAEPSPSRARAWRRAAATALLALVLWVGVFAPLAGIGQGGETDFSNVSTPQLFLLHGILLVTLGLWFMLGFAGIGPGGWSARAGSFARQFGLTTGRPMVELGLGIIAGLAAWLMVIAAMVGLAVLIWLAGGEQLLPKEPPALIPWVVGLPLAVRAGLSLSAGVVEELFFRGFLQPRIGIGLSSGLFVLAHASYEQPLMLVGVALLSLVFASLVRWRQSIWAAVVAHAAFDAIQLLIVIPTALEFLGGESEAGGALAAALVF